MGGEGVGAIRGRMHGQRFEYNQIEGAHQLYH